MERASGAPWRAITYGLLGVGLLVALLTARYFFSLFGSAAGDLGASRVPVASRPEHDAPLAVSDRAYHHPSIVYATPSVRTERQTAPAETPAATRAGTTRPPGPNAGDLTL